MDITIFLAQIWGPILVAVSLGFYFSRKFYINVYRNLEREPLAALSFGFAAMAAGIAHIMAHNIWGDLAETIITLLGWGLLLKGIILVVFPAFADRQGNWVVTSKMIPVAGIITLLLGIYLSWIAYFV